MSRDWTPEELQTASAAMKDAGFLSFEEFSAEVEAATTAKAKIEAFAEKQKAGSLLCPRCGELTIKAQLHTNALSRHAQIYVCDRCGTDEAVRDWVGRPIPLRYWAVVHLPDIDPEV